MILLTIFLTITLFIVGIICGLLVATEMIVAYNNESLEEKFLEKCSAVKKQTKALRKKNFIEQPSDEELKSFEADVQKLEETKENLEEVCETVEYTHIDWAECNAVLADAKTVIQKWSKLQEKDRKLDDLLDSKDSFVQV